MKSGCFNLQALYNVCHQQLILMMINLLQVKRQTQASFQRFWVATCLSYFLLKMIKVAFLVELQI